VGAAQVLPPKFHEWLSKSRAAPTYPPNARYQNFMLETVCALKEARILKSSAPAKGLSPLAEIQLSTSAPVIAGINRMTPSSTVFTSKESGALCPKATSKTDLAGTSQ
jgi:hypothetical protein